MDNHQVQITKGKRSKNLYVYIGGGEGFTVTKEGDMAVWNRPRRMKTKTIDDHVTLLVEVGFDE